MYQTLRTSTALLCALTALSGCEARTLGVEPRPPSQQASTRPGVPGPAATSEATLGLTRRLPPEYIDACTEILREAHANPCPPLVPDGTANVRGWGDSLEGMSFALNSINGRDVEANGGHWTLQVSTDQRARKGMADDLHAVAAKSPSQCHFLELEGQRVEACQVPAYPDGGYYGGHIAYAWQRGDVMYHITLHGYANEPRLRLMMAALIVQETSPRVRPRFETATIKRCADGASEKGPGQSPSDEPGKSGPASGRMSLNCRTLESLAATAYVQYENSLSHPRWIIGEGGTLPTGGPSWIRSDRYTVDATAKSTSSAALMLGPMLQSLLEDRFRLKVHYETRDVPVYDLTVVGGGWPRKLEGFKEGRCVPGYSSREDVGPPALPAGQRWCSGDMAPFFPGSPLFRLDVEGATIDELARLFLSAWPSVSRRVINRTGVPGRFDFHLEFAFSPDNKVAALSDARPPLFQALQEQLGLKLEAATGPARFLVVDRVERPTEH